MAQAVVSVVAARLGDLLIQQASFLASVEGQVEDLQEELLWIQSFLEDTNLRQDEGSIVRTWVSKIRDVAYDIEDIIDTYMLKVANEDVLNRSQRKRQFLGSLKRYSCMCKKGANLHTIGKDVEKLKTRIQKIGEEMQRYGINRKDGDSRRGDRRRPSSQERFQQLRRSSPYQDNAILNNIVGLDIRVEELVAELESEEDGGRFITITGMRGIGKTTLSTKVYNCEKVKAHFECRAWAYVSKDYNAKDILKRLIKEVKPNLSTEELQEMEVFDDIYLQEKLRELLKDRTYLVVLDDIWDSKAWESLKRAFPDNEKGRVILTSRNAKIANGSSVHQLPTLNEMESWKLFVIKAFGNEDCPADFEASAKVMVEKCGGLPLAITVLAGLLRGKLQQEWFAVEDRFYQQLMKGQGKNNIENILSLSYNDLPYQLKSCYLYIGLFPEDQEIVAWQLIWLWVAEGFIRCGRDETVEDVAMNYLNELIDRNMLQVVGQNDLGKVQYCQIHDLLRDLCISKGQEENFIDYSPCAWSCSSSSSTMYTLHKSRRYAIHSGIGSFDFSNLSNSHIRTLLLFNSNRESLQRQQLESISNIRLLRVLDLSYVDLKGMRLPDALGKLIHLRYLRLFCTKTKLPSSIENLRSLETLDLGASAGYRWSDIGIGALSKLTQLRRLILNEEYWDGLDREVAFKLRIDTLTNLHTLILVDALVWKQNEMTNLINLRKLRIIKIGASDVESVLSSIAKLDRIQLLILELSYEESSFPTLVPLSHCHHLQTLMLEGKIERLPQDPYHEFPPRLTQLCLESSRLHGPDAMAILEKLSNLIVLKLWKISFMGEKIVCSAQGFPQLCVLHISYLEIEEWEIKEGALPKLNRLSIWECRNLKKIPMGLRFVATLQMLGLYHISEKFWERFDKGEDDHEIGHIPSIETCR